MDEKAFINVFFLEQPKGEHVATCPLCHPVRCTPDVNTPVGRGQVVRDWVRGVWCNHWYFLKGTYTQRSWYQALYNFNSVMQQLAIHSGSGGICWSHYTVYTIVIDIDKINCRPSEDCYL